MALKKSAAWHLLGLMLLFLSLSCGPGDPGWQGRVEVRDGVTVVMNPEDPLFPDAVLELENDLTISGSEEDERQILQNIVTLDVDAEGRIYLLDEQAGDIKLFAPDGGFIRTMGRKGQGPGEFGFPIMLLITPAQEILVHDMGQRAIKFLDLQGNYLRQISIADKFQFMGPKMLPDGRMVGSHLIPAEQPSAALKIFDPELEPVETLVTLPVEPPPVLNYFASNSMTGLRWNLDYRNEIVWGDFLNPEYTLYIHDRIGKHVRTITREYQGARIGEAEKAVLLKKMFGDNPVPPQWDIRFPERFPPFSGTSHDDEGRLFVRTHESAGQEGLETYDVFDVEGRYVAKIGIDVPLMILKKGSLYTIVENPDGFRVAKRFKMRWNREI
jgi:hypothetical protein